MKYVYPAIFYIEKEGGYVVEFPDVSGALTQGETLYHALEMAEDSLASMLVCLEDSGDKILPATPFEKVIAEPSEYSTSAFVTLIKADTDAYRKMLEKMQEEETVQEKIEGAA